MRACVRRVKGGRLRSRETKTYPSDLSETQWAILLPLIPAAKPGGRPRTVDIRAVVNGIFSRVKTGCQWRWLPHEYPPWGTVAWYYREWRRDATWQTMHDAVREQVRMGAGRDATPSGAIIDSQSVKTTEKAICFGCRTSAHLTVLTKERLVHWCETNPSCSSSQTCCCSSRSWQCPQLLRETLRQQRVQTLRNQPSPRCNRLKEARPFPLSLVRHVRMLWGILQPKLRVTEPAVFG